MDPQPDDLITVKKGHAPTGLAAPALSGVNGNAASADGLLAYRVLGDGPPLLLIHGFGISFNIWRNLLPYLTPHFRCIMIELPGIGASPPAAWGRPYYVECAEALERVRRHLRIERWSLFSYSSGSRAAEAYIKQHPDRVARAVFLCPIHMSGWRWRLTRTLLYLDRRAPTLGRWALSGSRLRLLVYLLGFNGRYHPSVQDWTEEIARQDITTLRRTLNDIPDPGRGLLELARPALYIWGTKDIIPHRPRRRFRRRHVQVHRRIPADHSAPELAAEYVAQASLPFLTGPEGQLTVRVRR